MIGEKSGEVMDCVRRDGNGAGVEVMNGPEGGFPFGAADEDGAGSGVGSGSTAE
jgi:hypothetical protein